MRVLDGAGYLMDAGVRIPSLSVGGAVSAKRLEVWDKVFTVTSLGALRCCRGASRLSWWPHVQGRVWSHGQGFLVARGSPLSVRPRLAHARGRHDARLCELGPRGV